MPPASARASEVSEETWSREGTRRNAPRQARVHTRVACGGRCSQVAVGSVRRPLGGHDQRAGAHGSIRNSGLVRAGINESTTSGQVFWLPDRPTLHAFPGNVIAQWPVVDFVTGYSGGTATELHRSSLFSRRTTHPRAPKSTLILSPRGRLSTVPPTADRNSFDRPLTQYADEADSVATGASRRFGTTSRMILAA